MLYILFKEKVTITAYKPQTDVKNRQQDPLLCLWGKKIAPEHNAKTTSSCQLRCLIYASASGCNFAEQKGAEVYTLFNVCVKSGYY